MVRSLVEAIVEVLNTFPSKNGISKTISTATIIEGKPKPDLKKKMITLAHILLNTLEIPIT